ncbi:MAG TPA: FHA domain-containing protein [Streptosporangiaceae bacterium]|nr:FHA domain-containing protein [Streptosporangiaceae bacterium]
MPTCSAGHQSASTDFCDVCGMRLDVPGPAAAQPGQPGSGSSLAGALPVQPGFGPGPPASPGEQCPQCGAGRTGQFCEACGYSFASGARITTAPSYLPTPQSSVLSGPGAGPAAAGSAWTAAVTADRAYFDSVIAASGPEGAGIEFPAYCPERRFQLQAPEMRIGRRSVSRGLEPEIDLTGPPTDPGVSHLHAVLIADSDGGWTVFDPGSANGTQVNGREIAAGSRVRLRDGDRVCVGAWTVLTISAD